jgi:hypothetical protein
MRKSPIVRALVTPKMSGGVSGAAMVSIYGPTGLLAFIAFHWKPWAPVFPVLAAIAIHAFIKVLYRKDVYFFHIYKVYSTTADHYHPWSREDLRGRGARPKGFGRGTRC